MRVCWGKSVGWQFSPWTSAKTARLVNLRVNRGKNKNNNDDNDDNHDNDDNTNTTNNNNNSNNSNNNNCSIPSNIHIQLVQLFSHSYNPKP